MNRLLILTLLALPAAAPAQELNAASLDAVPGLKAEEAALAEPLKRPDAAAIMAELSTALRLSSKQEERISAAIAKKTKEFDRLMKEYDKNSTEEKKWLYKVNENRHGMVRINQEMPDLVREFLDDEQRQSYDGLLETKRKPAPAPAVDEAPAAQAAPAAKPGRKRRLVRRKKVPGKAGAAVPAAAAQPAAEAAGEEPGQVMVDKDAAPSAQPAQPKKKRVLKKRPLTKGTPPVDEYGEQLEGSKPANGQTAQPEPDEGAAGSYP